MLLPHARCLYYLRHPSNLFSHHIFTIYHHPEMTFTQLSPFLVRNRFSSSIPITPVAYPPKPKESHEIAENQSSTDKDLLPRRTLDQRETADTLLPLSPEESSSSLGVDPRLWTRRDVRFVKDFPKILPVSYPSKVAPLPEDRIAAQEDAEGVTSDLQNEAMKIYSDLRTRSYLGLNQEEFIPFPTLVKLDKRARKIPIDLAEAIRSVKASAKRNFVETVEAHVNLGVDPRRSDQMVRGALTLPHGTGKTVRVAVFAEGTAANEARAAGADVVGGDELIEEIKAGGGKINFDKCIATPMFMPRLSKIGRILGPRGLMPNPKLGSVTSEVSVAVKAAKCGRIDFKIDKTAIVHAGLGKVNFTDENLHANIGAFVNALLLAKPVGLKKTSKYAGYVKNFTLSSTMGAGFPVTIQSLSAAADLYIKVHAK